MKQNVQVAQVLRNIIKVSWWSKAWIKQATIDRRFYRGKYDAAQTIAAFSATLRNEVDLTQLSAQLVAVVEETMQPVHASLWLRFPEPSRERNTRLLPRLQEEGRMP